MTVISSRCHTSTYYTCIIYMYRVYTHAMQPEHGRKTLSLCPLAARCPTFVQLQMGRPHVVAAEPPSPQNLKHLHSQQDSKIEVFTGQAATLCLVPSLFDSSVEAPKRLEVPATANCMGSLTNVNTVQSSRSGRPLATFQLVDPSGAAVTGLGLGGMPASILEEGHFAWTFAAQQKRALNPEP